MPVREEEAALPPLLLEKADEDDDAPVTLRTEPAASCVAARRNIALLRKREERKSSCSSRSSIARRLLIVPTSFFNALSTRLDRGERATESKKGASCALSCRGNALSSFPPVPAAAARGGEHAHTQRHKRAAESERERQREKSDGGELGKQSPNQCFFFVSKKHQSNHLPLPWPLFHSEASSLARRALRQLLDALCPSGHKTSGRREKEKSRLFSSSTADRREQRETSDPDLPHALPAVSVSLCRLFPFLTSLSILSLTRTQQNSPNANAPRGRRSR